MKFICQLDYPDMPYITRTSFEGEDKIKGETTTVKSSGCGLCSSIMVLDRLFVNYDFTLQDAVELSYSVQANAKRGTTYSLYAPAFANKFDLDYVKTNDIEDVVYCLQTGGAVVAHVGGDHDGHIGVFSHGGHYVAVVGVEKDGRLAVLDPSYKEGKYLEEGRVGKVELKNGCIALCEREVLQKDCSNRDPSFHLFWRK